MSKEVKKVICVSNVSKSGDEYRLTVNKEYTVLMEDKDSYYIENDGEKRCAYKKELFVTPEEFNDISKAYQNELDKLDGVFGVNEAEDFESEERKSTMVFFSKVITTAELVTKEGNVVQVDALNNNMIKLLVIDQETGDEAEFPLTLPEVDTLIDALIRLRENYFPPSPFSLPDNAPEIETSVEAELFDSYEEEGSMQVVSKQTGEAITTLSDLFASEEFEDLDDDEVEEMINKLLNADSDGELN